MRPVPESLPYLHEAGAEVPGEDWMNLHDTMDAEVWAKEFIRINGGDLDMMRAWFANAIMCGWDHARGPINGDHAQHLLDKEAKNGL